MTEHERRFRETVLLCYRSLELIRHAREVIDEVRAVTAASKAARAARAASRASPTRAAPTARYAEMLTGPYGPH